MKPVLSILGRASVRGHEARRGLEQFAHHCCAALGLPPVTVEFSGSCSTAAISASGDMHLCDIADDAIVTRATLSRWVGYIVHELLHRAFTDFSARDRRAYVSKLHNAIEDAWIERRAIAAGTLGNIRGLLTALVDGMTEEAMLAVTDWADSRQYPYSLAVYCRGFAQRVPVPAALLPVWQEASRRIDACATSHDTLEIAQWVFDQINAAADEPQHQPPPQGAGGGQGAGEDQGEDQGQDAGQDAGKGQSEDSASDSAGDGASDGSGDEGQDNGPGEPTDAGKAQGAGESDWAREVEPGMQGDPASGGSWSTDRWRDRAPLSRISRIGINRTAPARLRHEVRKIFESTARDEFCPGRRSGALNPRALHRIPTGYDRPFQRRTEEDGIDSSVVILLDVSGSMYHPIPRIDTAASVAATLLETLSAAGVEVALLAFGEYVSEVLAFGAPWRKALPTIERLASQDNTNDYHALRRAHDMLLRRDTQRRVVISLTDGVGDVWRTRAQVDAGEALGITTIGIGIQYDVSESYGPNSVRVNTLADLATVALSRVKMAA